MKRLIINIFILVIIGCETKINKQVIATNKAPKAIGPYSQGIKVNNTLYLAGQIALDPTTGEMVKGGIEDQTQQVIKNLEAVLKEAGFELYDVVQTQIFLSDLNHYQAMNDVYSKYFNNSPPARAVVEAARIPRDALIEMMLVAKKP